MYVKPMNFGSDNLQHIRCCNRHGKSNSLKSNHIQVSFVDTSSLATLDDTLNITITANEDLSSANQIQS